MLRLLSTTSTACTGSLAVVAASLCDRNGRARARPNSSTQAVRRANSSRSRTCSIRRLRCSGLEQKIHRGPIHHPKTAAIEQVDHDRPRRGHQAGEGENFGAGQEIEHRCQTVSDGAGVARGWWTLGSGGGRRRVGDGTWGRRAATACRLFLALELAPQAVDLAFLQNGQVTVGHGQHEAGYGRAVELAGMPADVTAGDATSRRAAVVGRFG